MDNKKLADLLFPHITKSVEYFEQKYPKRNTTGVVTRFAPSPTGKDLHLGHLFNCLVASTLAKKSDGVYFLRIEDTDKKREVPGSVEAILKTLKHYNIEFNEGRTFGNTDKGKYGPYLQSERAEIYQTVAKKLVSEGKAYPCFCTDNEIQEIRQTQQELKCDNVGYYGKFAKCRNLTFEQIEQNIKAGKPFVIRLKNTAVAGDRFNYHDVIKGDIEMDANINDAVLLKSDGIPPYNFAHVCDDHFMHTTLVIRGEEYSGTPVSEHTQIFNACNFECPQYAHNPHIQKLDNGKKRKLSKSKDPEASVSFYTKDGYPFQAVIDYLLNLANSDFEDWRAKNPNGSILDFDFKLSKLSSSGSLFDIDKLNNISKNYISTLSAEEVYNAVCTWANEFNKPFFELLQNNKEFCIKMFNIDRCTQKPRKDIAKWSDVPELYSYFFSECYNKLNSAEFDWPQNFSAQKINEILCAYANVYCENDEKDVWFQKVKEISSQFNCATDMKEYKKNPQNFAGSVADVSTIIRLKLTGRRNTPDLYEIAKLLGNTEVKQRLIK